MTELDDFVDAWNAFVVAWSGADDATKDQMVRAALADGLPQPSGPPAVADPEDEVACEISVIEQAGALDVAAYEHSYRAVSQAVRDPRGHFSRQGWRLGRNPSRDFDTWWYWVEHLDPTRDPVNPLVHHLLLGRHLGLSTQPPHRTRTAASAPRRPVRRICLFAAYDPDDLVDDYVLDYLRELSRHADVYYLTDGVLPGEELAKLAPVTRGAWAIPHGRYDFGSFSLLADDLVGWDEIATYDELLLANDSCYLLRPLDEVFERMDGVACDFWGLQATKRYFDRDNGDDRPIPLEDAIERWAGVPDADATAHLHLSSYFVAFRSSVIADEGFRVRLSTVTEQRHKSAVIAKYEIGISHYLNTQGFHLAAFVDRLFPFHPLYTSDYFTLVGEERFPLLKRNLLSENPLRAPDLAGWKERIGTAVPAAPLETFERNLLRVAADDRLQAAFAVRTLPDGSIEDVQELDRAQFRLEDRWAPKFDHWWAFPVCNYEHTFAGNERAVFEEVRHDPSIKKIILTRSLRIDLPGENVVTVPLHSREGQHYLARAGQIFVKHGPRINAHHPLSTITHNFVNLWHGIPLKRFGSAMVEAAKDGGFKIDRNNRGTRAVVTSSRVDALTTSTAFFPLSVPEMWPTGLPRNDFITRDVDRLPEDLRDAERRLRDEVGDRRLVLFLPTYRDPREDAYFSFGEAEIEALARWAEEHNAVLGIREHMADRAGTYTSMLAPLRPLHLSARHYPDIEVLYRVGSALLSDYSSCLVDFLLTGRPVVSFAYDLDRYATQERGLFYDLTKVLPGPVCRTFDELLTGLHGVFAERSAEELEDYDWRRRLFFDHLDDQAAWRVVQRVKQWYVDPEPGPTG